jgi:hypothetical protein
MIDWTPEFVFAWSGEDLLGEAFRLGGVIVLKIYFSLKCRA